MQPPGDDSKALRRSLAGGERGALAQYFERHRARLRRMVALRMDQRVQGRVDPSDVLQEAYLEAADRAIQNDPRNTAARYQRGLLHEKLKAWGPAEADFSAAIEAASEGAEEIWTWLLARARCRERLGKLPEALADSTRVIELKPDARDAVILRSSIFRGLSDHAGALEDAERRLARGSGSADELNHLAWVLATAPPERRDLKRAESASRASLEREPGMGDFWNTLGFILFRGGDLLGALEALEKALAFPAGGTAFDFYLLSAIHDRQGRHDLARGCRAQASAWEAKAANLTRDQLQDLESLRREAEEASR